MTEQKPITIQDQEKWIVFNIGMEVCLLVFTGIVLDGGIAAGLLCPAILGHWVTIGFVALRRGGNLTKSDVALIQGGFFLYIWVVIAVWVVLGRWLTR